MHVLLRGIRLRGMADLVRTRDDHMVAKVARTVAGDADRREVERANRCSVLGNFDTISRTLASAGTPRRAALTPNWKSATEICRRISSRSGGSPFADLHLNNAEMARNTTMTKNANEQEMAILFFIAPPSSLLRKPVLNYLDSSPPYWDAFRMLLPLQRPQCAYEWHHREI